MTYAYTNARPQEDPDQPTPATGDQSDGTNPQIITREHDDPTPSLLRRYRQRKVTERLRAFGWATAPLPTGHNPPGLCYGTWTSPTHTTVLTIGEGEPEYSYPTVLSVQATGGLDTPRPWTLTGAWLSGLLPALLAAAVQSAWPAPDPITALQGDWYRQPQASIPRGTFYSDRWLQWEGTAFERVLREVVWTITADQHPHLTSGWDLCFAPGFSLHADLATPRHVVTALAIALNTADGAII